MHSADAKASDILREFIENHPHGEISIREMVHAFGARAFGFLILVFALICVLPLPIPGIHMFLALPLYYLTVQQIVGRREIWFPDGVLDYKLPRSVFENINKRAMPWIIRVEKVSKPRLEFLTRGIFYCIFGGIAFYITAFLSIPLPLTNLVPAIAISLMALGFLNRDGVALIIGALIGVLWSCLWFYIGITGLIFIVKNIMIYIS